MPGVVLAVIIALIVSGYLKRRKKKEQARLSPRGRAELSARPEPGGPVLTDLELDEMEQLLRKLHRNRRRRTLPRRTPRRTRPRPAGGGLLHRDVERHGRHPVHRPGHDHRPLRLPAGGRPPDRHRLAGGQHPAAHQRHRLLRPCPASPGRCGWRTANTRRSMRA